MRRLEKAGPAIIILLALAAIFVFPIGSAGAGSFYLSVAFLALALFLSSSHSAERLSVASPAGSATSKGKGLRAALSYIRLSPKRKELPSLFLSGIALFLASMLLSILLSSILPALGINDADLVEQKVLSFPLPMLLLAFTLVPIAEEALFRGYLFRQFTEVLPSRKLPVPAWAIGAILSSILFSATHFSYGSISEFIAAFVLGMLFCAATQREKSLVPAIVAHAFYNLFSIFFMVFM